MENLSGVQNVPQSNHNLFEKNIGFIIDGFVILLTIVNLIWGENPYSFIFLAVYYGLRLGTGIRIIKKQEYLVIERFGRFHRNAHNGFRLLFFPGLVDKIKDENTLAFQAFKIYDGDEGAKIDFTDASAPVDATVWYAIGNPKDKANSNWDQINLDIYKHTYAYTDPKQRLREVVDAFTRPRLQEMSLDEAQVEGTQAISQNLSNGLLRDSKVKKAMRDLGNYFDTAKPFVLSDIHLSKELEDARLQRLLAIAKADADREIGRGINDAIKQIQNNQKEDISFEDAARLFLKKASLETLEKFDGANIQLIGSDVGGVTRTFDIGKDTQ